MEGNIGPLNNTLRIPPNYKMVQVLTVVQILQGLMLSSSVAKSISHWICQIDIHRNFSHLVNVFFKICDSKYISCQKSFRMWGHGLSRESLSCHSVKIKFFIPKNPPLYVPSDAQKRHWFIVVTCVEIQWKSLRARLGYHTMPKYNQTIQTRNNNRQNKDKNIYCRIWWDSYRESVD